LRTRSGADQRGVSQLALTDPSHSPRSRPWTSAWTSHATASPLGPCPERTGGSRYDDGAGQQPTGTGQEPQDFCAPSGAGTSCRPRTTTRRPGCCGRLCRRLDPDPAALHRTRQAHRLPRRATSDQGRSQRARRDRPTHPDGPRPRLRRSDAEPEQPAVAGERCAWGGITPRRRPTPQPWRADPCLGVVDAEGPGLLWWRYLFEYVVAGRGSAVSGSEPRQPDPRAEPGAVG
jgi:hypothetical protein